MLVSGVLPAVSHSVLALYAYSTGVLFAQQTGATWKDYLGGPDSSHYSPLKQINASNVSRMKIAWTYPAPDGSSVFCPLVVDNIAYVFWLAGTIKEGESIPDVVQSGIINPFHSQFWCLMGGLTIGGMTLFSAYKLK